MNPSSTSARLALLLLSAALSAGCARKTEAIKPPPPIEARAHASPGEAPERREIALLAGGCFWGMEEILRGVPGVLETDVGYTGGTLPGPDYDDVKTGRTGHAESVRVVFDPARLSYEELLEK